MFYANPLEPCESGEGKLFIAEKVFHGLYVFIFFYFLNDSGNFHVPRKLNIPYKFLNVLYLHKSVLTIFLRSLQTQSIIVFALLFLILFIIN